jgi:hypothetical protein
MTLPWVSSIMLLVNFSGETSTVCYLPVSWLLATISHYPWSKILPLPSVYSCTLWSWAHVFYYSTELILFLSIFPVLIKNTIHWVPTEKVCGQLQSFFVHNVKVVPQISSVKRLIILSCLVLTFCLCFKSFMICVHCKFPATEINFSDPHLKPWLTFPLEWSIVLLVFQ